MEDSIIWYIVLGVIYLLSRLFKSKNEEPPTRVPEEQPTRQTSASPERRKPSTFEELLEQFGREETEEEEYEREERRQDERRATVEQYDDEVRSVYEKSVTEAKKLKTLDEQIDIENLDRTIKISKDARTSPKSALASRYAKMLRTPQGVRDAVILSEIFNRKY